VRIIETSTTIFAPPAAAWRTLVDFASYPSWNPVIISIEGQAAPGERLTVHMRRPDGREHAFRPWVLDVIQGLELRWRRQFVVSGLFSGEHSFRLESASGIRTNFAQRETFRGIVVPFMPRSFWDATASAFESMNAALKTITENLHPHADSRSIPESMPMARLPLFGRDRTKGAALPDAAGRRTA
jgi:hypothetical protein